MSAMATLATATIGFPRIGNRRQMKFALEKFWKGQSTEAELIQTTAEVQAVAWNEQKQAGIERVGLDGTLYDQVLDTTMWLGLAPARFQHLNGLAQYFAMARGAKGCIAQDMSKFFDTNYHYVVPELEAGFQPKPQLQHVLEKVARGQAAVGKEHAVPIIIGPVTYAYLAKRAEGLTIEAAVSALLPAYVAMLRALSELAVPEVQIHEPALVVEAAKSHRALYEATYKALSEQAGGVPLHLITYFDDLGEAYPWAVQLPVQAVYLDFLGVPGASVPNQTLSLLKTHGFPADKKLFAGVADGRSVWADDGTAMAIVSELLAGDHVSADRLGITSSAPLQLLPYDLRLEDQQVLANTPCLTRGGQVVGECLSFALQKLDEIVATAKAGAALAANPAAAATAKAQQAAGAAAETGVFEVDSQLLVRPEPYQARRAKQIKMPAFPTTTIGSFPQTAEVRRLRQQWKSGAITQEEYDRQITGHIAYCIGVQDALGIDVLVHGESERTDMVEYFGIKLEGMLFTQAGWVQSYGSRYVRPPIVASDIAFKEPMTVKEYLVAQSFTSKPVKGMLTGPVTILNWSFPRKDITRRQQALQLAAALRQEVAALEAAGCKIIQVDDPALREGLPLKAARWQSYLSWAVDAFRMCTAVAAPETQIVTHLCYSDFEDIMEAIDAMDADVLTIENSRSDNAMIAALAGARYGRDIGPGVYDVHSPVVPPVDFIKSRIKSFVDTGILGGAASADRIWVNPDCGLKTRGWQETIPALRNMVQAAAEARTELLAGGGATGGHSCGTGAGGAAYGGSAMPSAGGAVTTCCRCCLE